MQGLQQGKARSNRASGLVTALLATAGLTLTVCVGGCSAIETPLPDLKPVATSSLSQQERAKAVEELNRKRATHEQEAEKQIEQSR